MQKKNRKKLFELFEKTNSLIYLKGGSVAHRYDTDFEYAFRQESNFLYLTGIDEPDFQAVLDLKDEKFILIIPKRDSKYAVWMGHVNPADHYSEKAGTDQIMYDEEFESWLKNRKPELVYCRDEETSEIMKQKGYTTDSGTFPEALAYCRSIKSDEELDLMRHANQVASDAHRAAMKSIRPGMHEYEVKAVFEYVNLQYGLLHPPYNGIFASGKNGAILHYVDNNAKINDGDLFLVDAGSENQGYAADITRTYPANGRFSEIQGRLYDVVLRALVETSAGAQPGVKMEDLHLHAGSVILEGLKDVGLVKGNIKEMMEKNIFALFFPHGLGHFLGLDTHDVGGYLKGVERIDRPGLKFLRTRRTLEKGMVITIEPGMYFIPALLKPALEDKAQKQYLNPDKIEPLLDFGGIRIEDNLIITENGNENMTDVPKNRDEVEAFMQS